MALAGLLAGAPAAAEEPLAPAPAGPAFTLDDAFALALQRSPQLRIADEQVEQARAARLKSLAVLQPQVSLGAGYTLYDEAVSLDFGDLAGGTAATAALYGSLIVNGMLEDYQCEIAAPLLIGNDGEGIATCGELLSALLAMQEDLEASQEASLPTSVWLIPKHQVQAGLNVSLALTPRAPFLIRAAGRQVEASEAQRRTARQDLLFAVYQAYLGALRTEELVSIQEAAVETAQAHHDTTKVRFDLGQVPRTLVLRAEVEVIQARRDLEAARRARDEVRRALALAVGAESISGRVVPPGELALPEVDVEALTRQAMERRADVAAARAGASAADALGSDAVAQFLPAFSVGFQYGRTWAWAEDPETGEWVDAAGGLAGKSDQWTFTVQAQLPLWDGGTRIAQVKEAASRRRVARLQSEQLRQLVRKQVADAAQVLEGSAVTVEAARRQVDLAAENLRLTEARYQLGQDSQLSLLDARLVLEKARLGLLSEQLDRDLARATLLKAAGLFEPAPSR